MLGRLGGERLFRLGLVSHLLGSWRIATFYKVAGNASANGLRDRHRNGIPNLFIMLAQAVSCKSEQVWKTLQPRRLPH